MIKKLINIKVAYLIVFLSLVFWAFFAFFTMNQLISSQQVYAKLINISGKQRMLSQKTTLIAKRVYETNDKKLIAHLNSLIALMKKDHQLMIDNITTKKINNVYFEEPYNLNKKVKLYFNLLDEFVQTKDKKVLNKIEEYSFKLLPQLNYVVNEFEKESNQNTNDLKDRELLILFGTLLTILLEAIFIILPSIKKIETSETILQNLNETLEYKVKEKTKEQDELLSIFDKGETVLFKWNNDDKWSVNHVSSNVYQLLEYKDTDFYTNQISYEDCIFNEDLEVVRQEVIEASKLFANDYFQHKPYRVVTKTGKIKWVLDSSIIITDKSNNIINYLGHIIDITDLKNKEDMLYKSEKMASMGEMIGNIAHQWRQPLSAISTASTGIVMQKKYGILDETNLLDTCNKINDNAQYLSKTIDDFRNFIKGDRTKKLYSLKDDIDSFLHLIKGPIKSHNINIILNLQEDIKIDGYENELTQCLIIG